ncbi:hypothetical protein M422DRAFT_42392 [Sphaerobolus stellatus SS14]|nr:hypothetical protein M422DRAFT_42392 [Sphaerobolus stellatus SS14]
MAPATGAPSAARLVTGQQIYQVAPQSSAHHAVERSLPQAKSSVTTALVPQVARPLPPVLQPVFKNTHLVPGTTLASTVRLVTARPAREIPSQAPPASSIVEKELSQPGATRVSSATTVYIRQAAHPLPSQPVAQPHSSRTKPPKQREQPRVPKVFAVHPTRAPVPAPRSTCAAALQPAPIQKTTMTPTTKSEPHPTGCYSERDTSRQVATSTKRSPRVQATLPPVVPPQSRPLPTLRMQTIPNIPLAPLLAEPIESKPLPAPPKPVSVSTPKYTRVRGTNAIREVEPEPTTKSSRFDELDRPIY